MPVKLLRITATVAVKDDERAEGLKSRLLTPERFKLADVLWGFGSLQSLDIHDSSEWAEADLADFERAVERATQKLVNQSIERTEMVNGSELNVGDQVLIRATVTGKNEYDHLRITQARPHINRPEGLERPWNIGDQELWTWGTPNGSGDGNKDIRRVVK